MRWEDGEGSTTADAGRRQLPLKADPHELRVQDFIPHVHRDDVEDFLVGAFRDPPHLRDVRGVLPLDDLQVRGGPPPDFFVVDAPVFLKPAEVHHDVLSNRGPRNPSVLSPDVEGGALGMEEGQRPRQRGAPGARSFWNMIHTGCFTKPRASLMLRM